MLLPSCLSLQSGTIAFISVHGCGSVYCLLSCLLEADYAEQSFLVCYYKLLSVNAKTVDCSAYLKEHTHRRLVNSNDLYTTIVLLPQSEGRTFQCLISSEIEHSQHNNVYLPARDVRLQFH